MNHFSSHIPKKSLGQHFLIHDGIQNKIVDACRLHPDDIVLEIGPGKGAITRKLAQHVRQVIAIEKDRDLAQKLMGEFEGTNIQVIEADVLEYDFSGLPLSIKCVGNLPYNVASLIIEKILSDARRFTQMFAMVQLEQGERFTARPGSKDYGSLTCFVQYYSRIRKLFDIRPSAFQPPPKVDSCFLEFDIYRPDQRPVRVENPEKLFKLIRHAFLHRRKTIVNALSGWKSREEILEILERCSIQGNLRPENISLEQYAAIIRWPAH